MTKNLANLVDEPEKIETIEPVRYKKVKPKKLKKNALPNTKFVTIYHEDIAKYQDAVWQFLIDHAKISQTGGYRVYLRFFSRRELENRVKARYVHGYKVNDVKKFSENAYNARIAWKNKQRTFLAKIIKWFKKLLKT
jgi:hypothetical protein